MLQSRFFPPENCAGKVSVIVPILNEAPTIWDVVSFARRSSLTGEVLVIDDGSTDGSTDIARAAGAEVIVSATPGKGLSMEDGVRLARHEVLLYLDGDLRGLLGNLIERLTKPIFDREADFVKAKFTRAAGRVTVLTARPLLRTLFPELAHFEQPLGGIIAAKRSLLNTFRFENDYGVDIGLLIDEVDIGHIEHDSQPLEALEEMATQVARTILDRAARLRHRVFSHLAPVRPRPTRGAPLLDYANDSSDPEPLAV
jgi:glycosyltransferase involved in cell wall biosynthesis